MPLIGQFSRTKSGYAGRARTLSVDAEVVLVPADNSEAADAPAVRTPPGTDADGPEHRTGWNRPGETAGCHVPVPIDDHTPTARTTDTNANSVPARYDLHHHPPH